MKTRITVSLAIVACLTCAAGCEKPSLRGSIPDRVAAEELRVQLAKAKVDGGGPVETQTQTRTGWATLKGTIRVVGEVPPAVTLTVDKDTQVCAPGGQPVISQAVKVDNATKGLANVVFYALDLQGDNIHESAKPGKDDVIVFDQKKCIFLTHVQLMQTSQSLRILNSDSVLHNTKIDSASNSFNQSVPPGSELSFSPNKAEKQPVPVGCSVHPWMRAYLLARDDSYMALTATDGTFEIKNLPAGIDLTIQAWHETLEKNFRNIKVNGQPATWKRGRLSLKLAPDEVKTLEVEIPASAL